MKKYKPSLFLPVKYSGEVNVSSGLSLSSVELFFGVGDAIVNFFINYFFLFGETMIK